MKKYLLFRGYDYYPAGGIQDFKKDFSSLKSLFEFLAKDLHFDWIQIVEAESFKMIWDSNEESEEEEVKKFIKFMVNNKSGKEIAINICKYMYYKDDDMDSLLKKQAFTFNSINKKGSE